MEVDNALLYVGVVLIVCFVISGVVPEWWKARKRRERVDAFHERYRRWVAEAGDKDRQWLVARRQQMQVDAMTTQRGVSMIAPPPRIGGQFQPHQMFIDLFSEQTFAAMLVDEQTRLDELATVAHTLRAREVYRWREVFNPWAWVRRTFERIVGLPRYLLRTAGFSESVADGAFARTVTAIWSVLVGVAGIGSFALALFDRI